MKLYEKVVYINEDVKFAISNFIREYDISKANINVLLHKNVITQDEYNYYYNLDRDSRQKKIGILRKDYKIDKILSDGICEFRKRFFIANNIKDEEVLSIKNDAIYLINKVADVTKFDNVEFVCKNLYTSYYRLMNMEFYYYYDLVMDLEKLDVKGIKEEKLKLHENYFLEFLKECFYSAQMDDIKNTLNILITFYNKYLNMDVDIGYYRQFDYESKFLLKPRSIYSVYKSDYVLEQDKKEINIKHNLNILRELYQIYSIVTFKNKRDISL